VFYLTKNRTSLLGKSHLNIHNIKILNMKNKRIIAGIILGMATCLFTMNMNAQSGDNKQQRQKPPTIEELFKQMDGNEDGKLSLKEIKGPLKNDFKKIDTNKDGFLTKEELEKAPKQKKDNPSKQNRQ
jgi:Ca2+-binding EF-hand superfamily protein